jgi:Tfp pilus assembly protein PilO
VSLTGEQIKRVGVIAGINVVLVVAGWLLLVAPQRHDAQSAAGQLQQVQQQITQISGLRGTQGGQAKQPSIPTANLYRLSQAMPATPDESDLLLMLDQLAKASGVKVLLLSPQTPAAAIGYVALPVQLSLQGPYGALTRYVHRLRMLVAVHRGQLHAAGRLLAVTSVAMTPATTGGGETAAVDVNSFVYGSINGVAPLSATSTDTTSTSTSTTSTTTTTAG